MRLILILACLTINLAALAWPVHAENLRINLSQVSEPFSVSPHDMTLSPDGSLLVLADMGQDRVLLLDPDELTVQGVIGVGELSLPHDVVFDSNGRLLVADSGNDRIAIYNLDIRSKTAQLVETIDSLDGPEGIAIGPGGELFIAVTLEDRIIRMRNGQIEASATKALGTQFNQPHDIELDKTGDETTLVITDPGNNRLLVLDLNLNPKFEISAWSPPLSEPKYISIDDRGRLFVADQFNNAVRVFTKNANQVGIFAHQHVKLPEGILVVGERVWVADTQGGRVLLYRFQE